MNKNEALKIIGKQIRALRLAKNLSQHTLAQMCQVNKNYIGMIERGEVNPTIMVLISIANALKVSLSVLIKGI